jgi:hypothetical protein
VQVGRPEPRQRQCVGGVCELERVRKIGGHTPTITGNTAPVSCYAGRTSVNVSIGELL